MPNLRVISILFLLTLNSLAVGNKSENGTQVESIDIRNLDYKGILTGSMQKDMWIFVFLAAGFTFGLCFGVYAFAEIVAFFRYCMRRLRG